MVALFPKSAVLTLTRVNLASGDLIPAQQEKQLGQNG
jgi:hypothetical protein